MQKAHKKSRIMLIDDEEAIRATLSESLMESGYQVLCAADGAEGLRLLIRHTHPDIVITDLMMPHKEGLETISEIKRRYPNIKVVAISGGGRFPTDNFLEFAEKLGADATLPKPVDIDRLEAVLQRLGG